MDWKPTTIDEVKNIIQNDLADCDNEQIEVFERFRLQPYLAPIIRYGSLDNVFVVARKGDEVIYWEDVEEGFNLSPIAPDGRILQHRCNQDELRLALNSWIEGRKRPVRLGPATTIK